jgi:hypothetical protein
MRAGRCWLITTFGPTAETAELSHRHTVHPAPYLLATAENFIFDVSESLLSSRGDGDGPHCFLRKGVPARANPFKDCGCRHPVDLSRELLIIHTGL